MCWGTVIESFFKVNMGYHFGVYIISVSATSGLDIVKLVVPILASASSGAPTTFIRSSFTTFFQDVGDFGPFTIILHVQYIVERTAVKQQQDKFRILIDHCHGSAIELVIE